MIWLTFTTLYEIYINCIIFIICISTWLCHSTAPLTAEIKEGYEDAGFAWGHCSWWQNRSWKSGLRFYSTSFESLTAASLTTNCFLFYLQQKRSHFVGSHCFDQVLKDLLNVYLHRQLRLGSAACFKFCY